MKTAVMTFSPWEVGICLSPLIEHAHNDGYEDTNAWWAFSHYVHLKYRGATAGHQVQEPTDFELDQIREGFCFVGFSLSLMRERFLALEQSVAYAITGIMYHFDGQVLEGVDGQWEGTLESLPALYLIFDDTPSMLQQSLF